VALSLNPSAAKQQQNNPISIRRDKPNQAIMHINMKCHNQTPFFSYTKSENRRVEQVLPGGGWASWYQWEGRRRWGNGERE
jgi:hypothetical protein